MNGKDIESELKAVLIKLPETDRLRLLASAQALQFAATVASAESKDNAGTKG